MSYISRGVTPPMVPAMDRALIVSYLQAAEEHVANGERRSLTTRSYFDLRDGPVTIRPARLPLLRELKQTQMQHVAERDRLRAELAVLSAAQLGNRRRIRRTPYGRR